MLLPYGKKDGHLIHISEVDRGKTKLVCPYCQQLLIAKKGKKIAHHFAHEGKSCLSSTADFFGLKNNLPTHLSLLQYTQKKFNETTQQIGKLQKAKVYLNRQSDWQKQQIRNLVNQLSSYQEDSFKTVRKQIIQFCKEEFSTSIDWSLLHSEHFLIYTNGIKEIKYPQISPSIHQDFYPKSFKGAVAALERYHSTQHQLIETNEKLRLFQSDWTWFKQFKLYFLRINTGTYSTFYKIGLTSRDIAIRIKEIERDLASIFQSPSIEVLFQTESVAFLEHFFKQKYQSHRYHLEQFTEYFYFEPYELEQLLSVFKKVKMYKMDATE